MNNGCTEYDLLTIIPLDLDLIIHTITQFETIDAVRTGTYYKLLDIIYLHHI